MKYTQLLFNFLAGLLLTSCTDPVFRNVSQVVSEYEQTLDNSKIDLNLKVLAVDFVKDYFAKDSLEILKTYLNEKREGKLSELNDFLNSEITDSTDLVDQINQERDEMYKELYIGRLNRVTESIKHWRNSISVYNSDFKGTFLEPTFLRIRNLEKNPEAKLYTIYKVVYKINNPFLNNVEQELTYYYFINGDLSNIEKSPLKIVGKREEL